MCSGKLRRLCAQQAHCDAVIECLTSSSTEKITESQQDLLSRALGLSHDDVAPSSCSSFWASLPLAYRLRLLKRVLDSIPREDEANEALLQAYCNPVEDSEPGWSTQTFFVGEGNALRLRVSAGIGGGTETGGRVWDAALGLSAYFLAHPPLQRGLVVELGAGPGLPGLLLAQQGAAERIVLTDVFPQTLENLEHNAQQLNPKPTAVVQVETYDWCADAEANAARYDGVQLVLAADVVYEPELAEPLLNTLDALLRRHRSAVALLTAEKRGDAWRNFETRLGARLGRGELCCTDRSEEARTALRAEGCPFWCASDAIERLVLLEIAALDPGQNVAAHQASEWVAADFERAADRKVEAQAAAGRDACQWRPHVRLVAQRDGRVSFRMGYRRM